MTFDAAQRLLDLATAVRQDPDLPREALAALLTAHGEPPAAVAAGTFSENDARALRAAITRITRTVLTERDTDRAATALNALLADYAGPPRLSRHDGHPWHLHTDRGDDAPWDAWLIAASAHELARLLATHGRVAWGECAAAPCTRLYLDNGPGSARRYCAPRCASRARVAAHRARHTP